MNGGGGGTVTHNPIVGLQLLNVRKYGVNMCHLQVDHVPEALQIVKGGGKCIFRRAI